MILTLACHSYVHVSIATICFKPSQFQRILFQDPEAQLTKQLVAFYALHNPDNIGKAAELARQYVLDVSSLNQALLMKYEYDLTTLPTQVSVILIQYIVLLCS